MAKQQDFVLKERAKRWCRSNRRKSSEKSQLEAADMQKQRSMGAARSGTKTFRDSNDQDCITEEINRQKRWQGTSGNQRRGLSQQRQIRQGIPAIKTFLGILRAQTGGLDLGTGGLSQGIPSTRFAFRLDARLDEKSGSDSLVARFQSGSTRDWPLCIRAKAACCKDCKTTIYSESYSSE
jgi:hypothetical protein